MVILGRPLKEQKQCLTSEVTEWKNEIIKKTLSILEMRKEMKKGDTENKTKLDSNPMTSSTKVGISSNTRTLTG